MKINPNSTTYRQGYFIPKNPQKYVGNINQIFFRSSWEYKFMMNCDMNPDIIQWSSEPFPINYLNPIDTKIHKYYVDFWIKVNEEGTLTKYLIEIKPQAQLKLPVLENKNPKPNQLRNHIYEKKTYIINLSKWNAAFEFCKNNDMQFKILTEKELKIPVKTKTKYNVYRNY